MPSYLHGMSVLCRPITDTRYLDLTAGRQVGFKEDVKRYPWAGLQFVNWQSKVTIHQRTKPQYSKQENKRVQTTHEKTVIFYMTASHRLFSKVDLLSEVQAAICTACLTSRVSAGARPKT